MKVHDGSLSKSIPYDLFDSLVANAKDADEMEICAFAFPNFHYYKKPLTCSVMDKYVMRLAEFGLIDRITEVLSAHREYLYYPSPGLITNLAERYSKMPDVCNLKKLCNAINEK